MNRKVADAEKRLSQIYEVRVRIGYFNIDTKVSGEKVVPPSSGLL